MHPKKLGDGVVAGSVAAILSGIPSTAHAFATRRDPLEATYAAGTMAVSDSADPLTLLAAGAGVHIVISLGWGIALSYLLPRRATVTGGVVGGLAIAALDLGVIGRRWPRISALPVVPQVADHVAFGAIAGAVIARRRTRH